jgi:hypothetical protein
LEDNLDRLEIMRGIVTSLPCDFELRHFDAVGELRAHASTVFQHARLISLDYCLEGSRSNATAPGTGMDAVKFLMQRNPVCPVIVHTALARESAKMAEALTGRGWKVKRVDFGSGDREGKWRAAAMQLMGLPDGET